MMSVTFTRVMPTLASLDYDRTEVFYRDKLGFRTLTKVDDFLSMERDGFRLHFWRCTDVYIAQNTSCYVYVTGVDELYAEYQAEGVVHPNSQLGDRGYGVRDFAILDVDGNLITFGELID
jgi:catechol 2,3-dioxygenase-like lactoylglutathione lyase family enzyme